MDRVTVAITRYVIAKMGEKYVQPPTLDYAAIYRQSSNMTPVVFVLSPGADPAFDVFKLGKPVHQPVMCPYNLGSSPCRCHLADTESSTPRFDHSDNESRDSRFDHSDNESQDSKTTLTMLVYPL